MLLAIDIGNSETSFGLFKGGELSYHWSWETQPSRTGDELASFLLPLLAQSEIDLRNCKGIGLCSVVPAADKAVEDFSERYVGKELFKVTPYLPLDFKLNVEEPHAVGADRLANTAYVVEKLKLPAVVVDFGTATTFDVISKEGNYEGGVILPGVRMAVAALHLKTSQLPSVPLKIPSSVIGKTTAECIQAGVVLGYCDLVEGLLRRTRSELGSEVEVVLTGGFASLLRKELDSAYLFEPDLTLHGVRMLWGQHA